MFAQDTLVDGYFRMPKEPVNSPTMQKATGRITAAVPFGMTEPKLHSDHPTNLMIDLQRHRPGNDTSQSDALQESISRRITELEVSASNLGFGIVDVDI